MDSEREERVGEINYIVSISYQVVAIGMKMLQNVRLRQNFAIFWVDLYDEREKEKTRLGEQRLKTIKREGKDKSLHCVCSSCSWEKSPS